MLHMQSSRAQVARWCLLTSVPRKLAALRICLWKHSEQGLVWKAAVQGPRSKVAFTTSFWDAPQTSGHSKLKAALSSLPTWVFHSEKLHWKGKRRLVTEKKHDLWTLSRSQPKRNAVRLEKEDSPLHTVLQSLHRKKFKWKPSCL